MLQMKLCGSSGTIAALQKIKDSLLPSSANKSWSLIAEKNSKISSRFKIGYRTTKKRKI